MEANVISEPEPSGLEDEQANQGNLLKLLQKSDVSMYTIHALHADFYWPLYSLGDICRVCRCEGTAERPLFHPCICTGSIKYIHQECLLQWLKYSKKEFCELCSHRFSFTPSKKNMKYSVKSIEFVLTHVNCRITFVKLIEVVLICLI